jgi:hypothetical protein
MGGAGEDTRPFGLIPKVVKISSVGSWMRYATISYLTVPGCHQTATVRQTARLLSRGMLAL